MNTTRRRTGLSGCLLAAAIFVPLLSPAREAPVVPADPSKATVNSLGFAGTATCSARGCHGAIAATEGSGIARNESSIWARYDKHATAFDALLSDRAKTMAQNLAPTNDDRKAIDADKDARCLACHTTPESAAGASPEMRDLQKQGIGCETCHGPARKGGEGWLDAHTTEKWKHHDPAEKLKLGMRPLSDSLAQAQVCVGCHVGAPAKEGLPARDLNHDLMAAGHPRLIFELSSYQANMPPHWSNDKYKGDQGRGAKLWAVARFEAARAALELLESRAEDFKKPWPEFAECDCFACHANLRPENRDWRQNRTRYRDWRDRPGFGDFKPRLPGTPPYNVWFSTGLPELAKVVSGPPHLPAQFARLNEQMSRPLPDRETVGSKAADTRKSLITLADAVNKARFDATTVRSLMKDLIAANEKRLDALSWDEATQLVYGLAVLSNASGTKRREVTEQFARVYGELVFPPGFESPAEFRISASSRTTDQLTQELAELLKLLGEK
jgi:hypothetical protein